MMTLFVFFLVKALLSKGGGNPKAIDWDLITWRLPTRECTFEIVEIWSHSEWFSEYKVDHVSPVSVSLLKTLTNKEIIL